MVQTKAQKAERTEAIEKLRELLEPGDTVYTILRHVSRSGMMRHISPILIKTGEHYVITRLVALATDSRMVYSGHDAIKVAGAGMDMGFSLIYDLTRNLFPNGFNCTGEKEYPRRCPSNDHSNIHTAEELEAAAPPGTCTAWFNSCFNIAHGTSRDFACRPWRHSDGGYALKQVWL